MQSFDLVAHLYRQRAFSRATFGPGARTKGMIDHIRKELVEIEKSPNDLTEWVDVILLALDGAWRAGHAPAAIAGAIRAKQDKNELRDWPDWRAADPDKAIEHVRLIKPQSVGKSEMTLAEISSEVLARAPVVVTNTPRAAETAEQAYARTAEARESFRAEMRAGCDCPRKRVGFCLFPCCECGFPTAADEGGGP
ncbi:MULTISPECIES: dATP/dGTP pyrophosphohydrolase domain-containing protein [unclassified Bradyrhizobium]|uniref:dATP/dGTP pyrophosphohydrolase domain-containing protein n=1 Tax=unclassified Bradyrhizobium TaxID=2631580 RepID=UPI0029166957|nr:MULTISPECIES: dATP/dGTP pyrophosphohydrolase domain-containing protein [unclassified Bradyrhizobium]